TTERIPRTTVETTFHMVCKVAMNGRSAIRAPPHTAEKNRPTVCNTDTTPGNNVPVSHSMVAPKPVPTALATVETTPRKDSNAPDSRPRTTATAPLTASRTVSKAAVSLCHTGVTVPSTVSDVDVNQSLIAVKIGETRCHMPEMKPPTALNTDCTLDRNCSLGLEEPTRAEAKTAIMESASRLRLGLVNSLFGTAVGVRAVAYPPRPAVIPPSAPTKPVVRPGCSFMKSMNR